MTYNDLKQLRVFFSALKDVGFRSNLKVDEIPPSTILDGKRTPVDKTRCLKLLYPLLGLKGEDEETDNQAVIKYLSSPKNRELFLGKFTSLQQTEFKDLLVGKPPAVKEIGEQPTEKTNAPQTAAQQAEVVTTKAAGNNLPPMPLGKIPTATFSQPPIIFIPPETETPKKETKTAEEQQTSTAGVAENFSTFAEQNVPIRQPVPNEETSNQTTNQGEFFNGEPDKMPTWQEQPISPPLSPVSSIESAETVESLPPASGPMETETTGLGSLGNIGAANPGMRFQPNFAKNFSGGAGNFLKTNLGNIGQGIGRGLAGAARPLGKLANGGLGAFGEITKPGGIGGIGGTSGPKPPGLSTGKKTALIFTALFLLIIITGFTGGFNTTIPAGQAAPLPTTPIQTNLAGCKFTRDGAATPIASSRLMSFFSEAAAKTGVPAAALATLAMHESHTFTSNAQDNHDAFGSNNITNPTGCTHFVSDGKTGKIGSSSTGALGLMQVQPPQKIHDAIAAVSGIPSFSSVGAYSADGVGRGAGFVGKTADTLTLQDFCDVKTSIYLGAGVLISKNGGKPPTTGDEVNKSVCSYYGSSCVYSDPQGVSHNYGAEAQQDFENCKPSGGTTPAPPGPIGVSLTCPVENPKLTCGTAAHPAPNGCGHGVLPIYPTRCNPYYYICDTSSPRGSDGWYEKYSPPLYHAIDVQGSTTTIKMPYINGNESVTWTRIRTKPDPIPIGANAEWGYRINFTTKTAEGKNLYLDLTHLSLEELSNKDTLNSGDTLGTYFTPNKINHLHIGLSVDGNWVEPVQDANMCGQ